MINKISHLRALHIASGDLWAGAEVQLFTLAKELQSIPDITVEVLLLNHGKLEQELRAIGIHVTVIDETQLNGIKILFRLISHLHTSSPDIIHTHRLKENILGSIAAYICGNIPSLRTVHGAPERSLLWRQPVKIFLYWLDWFCGRFIQKKIISVSENLTELLVNRFPPEKINTIENGVDLKTINKYAEKTNATSEIIQNDCFKVGIVGRLVPIKRVDIFIRTARYILDYYPEYTVEFHIYGDGPLRNELVQLSHKLNTDSIVYFEGHCNNILEELGTIDALLMTSDHEGLPMILLEAMATKTAVISHAVGGIPNLLNHGTCGTLISENTPSHYAEAICKHINNDYQKLIERALDRVTTNYSADINANACLAEYKLIVSA